MNSLETRSRHSVQRLVSRRRTGYKDKNGKTIREGDTVGTWMTAPWDEEVPIFRTFKVEREPGVGWMCKGEQSNDEDDRLKHFKHLEIQKAKPANSR